MNVREAAATVDRYVRTIMAKEKMVTRMVPSAGEYIQAHILSALAGSPGPLADQTLHERVERDSGRLHKDVMFIAQDAAVRRLWQQNRIVYHTDPDLWSELGDTDPDTVIPPDLFSRLPHPDPFIVMPEPMVLPMPDGYRQVIDGFFVRGDAMVPIEWMGAHIQTSTHAPNSIRLGLLFTGAVESMSGKPLMAGGVQDVMFTRVTLDPKAGNGTVADMIDSTMQRFGSGLQTPRGRWQEDIPAMIRRAVSLLVYLCAENSDTQPVPKPLVAPPRKATGGQRPAKPPTVIGVGYRVGKALREHRAAEREAAAVHVPTGRTMAPHIRRAHFHTFKVGKGRTETRVRWLAPIPINLDGPADQATIIKVPGRRGK